MADFFNPGSPKFRRGVFLASVYACSFMAMHVVMADFGSQDHVFTPIQTYVNKRGDGFFKVTHAELHGDRKVSGPQGKPFMALHRVDVIKKD
jgi:hypothetical protein